jgi:hypothetical protein
MCPLCKLRTLFSRKPTGKLICRSVYKIVDGIQYVSIDGAEFRPLS